jgi:hypothetical protein
VLKRAECDVVPGGGDNEGGPTCTRLRLASAGCS